LFTRTIQGTPFQPKKIGAPPRTWGSAYYTVRRIYLFL
jgi:hypothetical protein